MSSPKFSKHSRGVVHGIETDVLVQRFADRVLVLVTQLGKVGSLVNSSPTTYATPSDEAQQQRLPAPSPAIQLTPLLGSAPTAHVQTLHSLYVAQIATLVWTTDPPFVARRSVIVGLALKGDSAHAGAAGSDGAELSEAERATFSGVMALVREVLLR
ncbi:hypothetical protein FISHEDRAFT_43754 [Fistulina hepatica ATCC 64428]|uniref:Proteasome assembly chaperone 3 n=1 Tax=Fistulina hepatica ATCC 64428 TaxID=1128425 RepID=A0A0D7AC66_9AGAR|nr:hypothetical protein FISHEDRAFT_43754 [Fistulina hepatica ATCC 64428]